MTDYYICLEYVDYDLARLLKHEEIEWEEDRIKCILRQLMEGVKYLHDSHIMHRDLKPANLLVSSHGVLKIADFGTSFFGYLFLGLSFKVFLCVKECQRT